MEKSSEKLTDINQIGEFGLIDLITNDFDIVNDSTELSIGDDAAILNYKNQKTVVSTDMLFGHNHNFLVQIINYFYHSTPHD